MVLGNHQSQAIRVSGSAGPAPYSWPGNLRQLRYVLRLSIALLDGKRWSTWSIYRKKFFESPPVKAHLARPGGRFRHDWSRRRWPGMAAMSPLQARELGITRPTPTANWRLSRGRPNAVACDGS